MAGNITDPQVGYGLVFKLANAGGQVTALDQVFDLKPPNEQADRTEVTHYQSPQRRKQYIDGLIDAADVAVQMNWTPGSPTDQLCLEAKGSQTNRQFEMDIPAGDGSTWKITGICVVRGYERTAPIGGKKVATLTISFNGAITEAAVAAGGGS